MDIKKEAIPYIFYYYIHFKLKEHTKGQVVQKRQICSYLSEWRIPKNIRRIIVGELITLGLIEKVGRNKVIIQNEDFMDFNNINSIYETLGLIPSD